jgi:integrase/recombinase XerD
VIRCALPTSLTNSIVPSGMRVGELVTTKIEDIDFENGFIRIQSFRSKTGRSRTARISKNTLELLREYIHGRKTGYVFRSQGQSGHLSTRRVEQIISKLADKAEIQEIYAEGKDGKKLSRITPHTLRHTHIVHAIMSGVPLAAVMKQVGHADIRTTQIYSTLAPEQVKEAYEKFEDSE